IFGLAELGFYAACATRTPLVAALALSTAYVAAMVTMFPVFGNRGLAIARSLAYLLGAGAMCYLLRHRFGDLQLARLGAGARRIALATAVMALGIVVGVVIAKTAGGA